MSEKKPFSGSQIWALSLAGIVTVMESKNISNMWCIGGWSNDEKSRDWARFVSKKLYGIESRDDLLKMMDYLTLEGHSVDMQNELAELPDDSSTDNYRQRLLRDNADMIRRGGCDAWDLARAATIAGWGALGQFIEEEEFWQMIKPIAERAQQTYNSWEEYANGYEMGRLYWADGAEHQPTTDAIQKLLSDPVSPWVQMKWKTGLGYIPASGNTPAQSNAKPSNAESDDPEIFPGQPIARLSDYVKLIKMAQSGQMIEAIATTGLDMMSYSQAMQRWGMKLATDTALAMKFGQMM